MARTGARFQGDRWRRVRDERTGRGIKSIDHDAIDAEVSRDQESIGGVERDRVSVRTFLASGRASALPGNHRDGRFKPPLGVDGEKRVVSAGVVRDGEKATCLVELEVARMGATRRLRVDRRQLRSRRVNRK